MSSTVTHQSAELTTASTIQWDTGDNFNGFVLLLAVPPGGRSSLYLRGEQRLRVPTDSKHPIIDGAFCDFSKAWFTTEFDPPNTLYCDLWYDNANSRLATGSSLFTITADPHTLTVPTLTAPAAGSTHPDPDVPLTDSSILGTSILTPTIEQASGTGSSVTISNAPTLIYGIYFNGVLLQQGAGNDYTVSGTTITFTTLTVGANDIVMAIYTA